MEWIEMFSLAERFFDFSYLRVELEQQQFVAELLE